MGVRRFITWREHHDVLRSNVTVKHSRASGRHRTGSGRAQQFVVALQVDPELWCGSEDLGELLRHGIGNDSLTVDDFVEVSLGYANGLGEAVDGDFKRLHELFFEDLAWGTEVTVSGSRRSVHQLPP